MFKLKIQIVFLIVIIASCGDNRNICGDNIPVNVQIKRNFLNSEGEYTSHYYSLSRIVNDSIVRFDYVADSTYSSKQSFLQTRKNKKLTEHTLSIYTQSCIDTLYLSDTGKFTDEYNVTLKFILEDSIKIEIDGNNHTVYCYHSLNEDTQWEENIFFTKKWGYLFDEFTALNTEDELIQHDCIENSVLKKLISEIKKHK